MNLLRHRTIGFLAAFLIVGIFIPWKYALAQGGRFNDWHMGPGMMGSWGMGWFGGIFMIFFWVLIIVGAILFIRWLIQSTGGKEFGGNTGSNALAILKERYARGDIDLAQFESMKQDLENKSLPIL